MAKGGKQRGARVTRNPELVRGVRRFGRTASAQRSATYLHSKKGLGKSTAHQTPQRADRMEGRFYASDDTTVPLRSSKLGRRAPVAPLRKSIRAGTVVILLAGRFRGKRVIVLKHLPQSGMLLVTGQCTRQRSRVRGNGCGAERRRGGHAEGRRRGRAQRICALDCASSSH